MRAPSRKKEELQELLGVIRELDGGCARVGTQAGGATGTEKGRQ